MRTTFNRVQHIGRPSQIMNKLAAIIGGGPAGLTAAYMLSTPGSQFKPVVFEASDSVGGIARTENYKGYRFDIGGHRFFTKIPEVQALWREICGNDLVTRPRLSRIYYGGKYYSYPLKAFNALSMMGPIEAARILLSYLKWQIRPYKSEDNFEQWVINRFGGRLYLYFFKTYTEKVWGIPGTQITSDWAAQRIKNLSLAKAVWNAISGANDTATLIEKFEYPRLGPGMMWEKCRDLIQDRGGEVRLNCTVTRITRVGNHIHAIEIANPDDTAGPLRVTADEFISTMALADLIGCIEPAPPEEVVRAAQQLKYRDFLIVTLILDHSDPFPDNWIYIHSPDVKVGRIQNFRAWSPDMVPDPRRASIGMEYFCHAGDGLWSASDDRLIDFAANELDQLGLAPRASVVDGTVIRQPKAYPVYDGNYGEALQVIQRWLGGLENFQTVGRNGLHRYNNQDHSMLTAMLAVQNLRGGKHNLWSVNVERSYHEQFTLKEQRQAAK
jgi:protoporphyrinogen oxidase